MKHIIVPTDFSENAFREASFAISLAIEFNANILIIHAYYPFKSGFLSEKANIRDELRSKEEAEREMKKFIEKLNIPENKLNLEAGCYQGNLLHTINDLGTQMQNVIVVMGTTGATDIKYKVIGSNTLYVAKNSLFPLIAVPNGTENFTVNKIALFTDYRAEDKNTLASLVSFFGNTVVTYSIIHIYRSKAAADKEVSDKLKAWAGELQTSCEIEQFSCELLEGKEEVKIVDQFSERNDINLLALTMTENNFWDKLFEKSFAKSIILQSKTPVFIQPQAQK